MIYTVTFNPSLDYFVTIDDFSLGKTNRTTSEQMVPGGKGLNVSILLKNLGIESTSLGFVAGFVGDEIIRRFEELSIPSEFIRIPQGCSRINVKLKNYDGTEINGMGPAIGSAHLEALFDRLLQLREGDTLVLAGSIPSSLPASTYRDILEKLTGKNLRIVVDATKNLLLEALPYRPFLIKPNHHELGELFGVTLTCRTDVIPYAQKLREMGARNVLVSMGEKGAVLAAEDGSVHESPAPCGTLINAVGAGDSMVAGFLAGCEAACAGAESAAGCKTPAADHAVSTIPATPVSRPDYAHAFKMGLAAGSASAFSHTFATREEVMALYRRL